MVYVFIGIAFGIGVMVGLLLYAGFAEGYFFPSERSTMHKLLDKHLTDIAKSEKQDQKASRLLRRR